MLMTMTEKLTLAKLREIASAEAPCITIVLPRGTAGDVRIAFKDALADVRGKLEARVPKSDTASLLQTLDSAASETIDSSKEPATFIFLSSPGVCESFARLSFWASLSLPSVTVSVCAHYWNWSVIRSTSTFLP
jgi:hypothetical protein